MRRPFLVRLMNDWSGVNSPPPTPCWLAMLFVISMIIMVPLIMHTRLRNLLHILQLLHLLSEHLCSHSPTQTPRWNT